MHNAHFYRDDPFEIGLNIAICQFVISSICKIPWLEHFISNGLVLGISVSHELVLKCFFFSLFLSHWQVMRPTFTASSAMNGGMLWEKRNTAIESVSECASVCRSFSVRAASEVAVKMCIATIGLKQSYCVYSHIIWCVAARGNVTYFVPLCYSHIISSVSCCRRVMIFLLLLLLLFIFISCMYMGR